MPIFPATNSKMTYLTRTLDDSLALTGGYIVRNLGGVLAVVHHEQLQVPHVGDDVLVEAAGQDVACLLVGSITNVGHSNTASLELPADPGVNTLWPPPAFLRQNKRRRTEVSHSVPYAFGGAQTAPMPSREFSRYCSSLDTLTAIFLSLWWRLKRLSRLFLFFSFTSGVTIFALLHGRTTSG